jgi:hypothetical protein
VKEVLSHGFRDLVAHNPWPYALLVGSFLACVLAIVEWVREGEGESLPLHMKIGVIGGALVVMALASNWAEDEARDYCHAIRDTSSWTTQHCFELDPGGSPHL